MVSRIYNLDKSLYSLTGFLRWCSSNTLSYGIHWRWMSEQNCRHPCLWHRANHQPPTLARAFPPGHLYHHMLVPISYTDREVHPHPENYAIIWTSEQERVGRNIIGHLSCSEMPLLENRYIITDIKAWQIVYVKWLFQGLFILSFINEQLTLSTDVGGMLFRYRMIVKDPCAPSLK